MLAVILLSFAMPSSFHKHSATKSSADLPPWRSTWQAIPRPFFHLFVSPIHHHALIGQRPPGSTRARLVVSEIACACACLGLPDDAVDGRGVRAARQASRWLIAIRRAGCVEKSKRQIGNSDCNPVPFSLVTSSYCTIFCTALAKSPGVSQPPCPAEQPPAVSIIILHSFCLPPILPPSTPPP